MVNLIVLVLVTLELVLYAEGIWFNSHLVFSFLNEEYVSSYLNMYKFGREIYLKIDYLMGCGFWHILFTVHVANPYLPHARSFHPSRPYARFGLAIDAAQQRSPRRLACR